MEKTFSAYDCRAFKLQAALRVRHVVTKWGCWYWIDLRADFVQTATTIIARSGRFALLPTV